MKANKKIVTVGCGALATSIVGASALAALATVDHDVKNEIKETKPYGRKNYEHMAIGDLINRNDFKSRCVNYVNEDNYYVLAINEQNFRTNIDQIIRSALGRINIFKNNYQNFVLEVRYQILSSKTYAVDVV